MPKRLSGLPATLLVLLLSAASASAEVPRVAVSIKPLHSLIAGVMEGLGDPYLIVKGGETPHDYALKPSDGRELSRAQLVFWVGPALEGFLTKPLAALAGKARIVEFASKPIMSKTAEAKETDFHLWLDPGKARSMIALAVAELSALDPKNIFQYRANGKRLSQRIYNLEENLDNLLEPVSEVPFIVYHNAFSHLARAYGLNIVGAITTNPEIPPGTRRLIDLHNKIKKQDIRCVFREPNFNTSVVYTLIEGTNAQVGFLDAVGGAREPGPELYFRLMLDNAESLAKCLNRF